MSYMLSHLHNGWQVDQAILSEEDRVVVIRFGHDWDPMCMKMDEVLYNIAEKVKNFAVIYLVDITEVPDFNKMYELYDPCTVMFFFRNKHIMIDLGTEMLSRLTKRRPPFILLQFVTKSRFIAKVFSEGKT
ncbi:thioredoxin-like protein 4A isoform X2 [Prorops nasuta]|uniref:thioredoxin-like protein 4A isoform X2 n=1 Tax=Prorops nasuta TaxID=863751 RepID=UPI0034CFDE32